MGDTEQTAEQPVPSTDACAPEHELTPEEAAFMGAVAFVGDVLSPFFLEDPRIGDAAPNYQAMAALDPAAAAQEWPFTEPAEAEPALRMMVEGLAKGHEDYDLVVEYRRLFIGPAAKPCPPWGSVYTDRECVCFGLTCLDLRRWMRENGIARLSDEHTPEDHIGLMLALMAHVAIEKPEVLDDYLQNHLLTWSSHFLTQLEEAAKHPFYQGLARITRLSLEGIQEMREIKVTYPRFYR